MIAALQNARAAGPVGPQPGGPPPVGPSGPGGPGGPIPPPDGADNPMAKLEVLDQKLDQIMALLVKEAEEDAKEDITEAPENPNNGTSND